MKKLFRIALAFLLVFMLMGCVRYTITVNVDKDGNASLVMEQLMLKEYLDDAALEEMYQSSLEEIADTKGATVKKVERTIEKQEYRGCLIEYPNAIAAGDVGEDLVISKNGDTITIKLPMESFNSSLQSEQVDLSTLKAMGASMVLIINMPGNITASSGGEVSGKTLTVDLLTFEGTEISATAKVSGGGGGGLGGNTLYYIIGGVAAVTVIGVAAVVLGKKKKAEAE